MNTFLSIMLRAKLLQNLRYTSAPTRDMHGQASPTPHYNIRDLLLRGYASSRGLLLERLLGFKNFRGETLKKGTRKSSKKTAPPSEKQFLARRLVIPLRGARHSKIQLRRCRSRPVSLKIPRKSLYKMEHLLSKL